MNKARTAEFEQFWAAYPRRLAKLKALSSFEKALKIASFEEIMDGVAVYAASRAGQDPQFTCHPSTWLNQGRWMDEPEQPRLTGIEALQDDLRRRAYDDQRQHGQRSVDFEDARGLSLIGWEGHARHH